MEYVPGFNNGSQQQQPFKVVKCAAKYIDIKLYVVKEKIQNHFESIDHISTKQVLADPLTKG